MADGGARRACPAHRARVGQPHHFSPQIRLWTPITGLLKGLNNVIPFQGCRGVGGKRGGAVRHGGYHHCSVHTEGLESPSLAPWASFRPLLPLRFQGIVSKTNNYLNLTENHNHKFFFLPLV